MKKINKIASLGLSILLLSGTLTGCITKPIKTYLKESQKVLALENYDFVHNVSIETKIEEQKIDVDFTLEGEIIKNDWFYTKVIYKDKQFTEIMLKDEKLVLNVGAMVRSLTPNEIITNEVIQIISIGHTMLFDGQDYLEINLKEYGLSSKDLFELYKLDENSFYGRIFELYITETSNLLQKHSKEVLVKEKNTYTLNLNSSHFEELSKNILTNIETNKNLYNVLLLSDAKNMIKKSKDLESSSIYKEFLDDYELKEDEIKEFTTKQLDSFIESLKNIDYNNIKLTQTLTVEKGEYLIDNLIQDDNAIIKISSIIKEKKDNTTYNYGNSLPTMTFEIKKLIENLVKY